MKWNKKPKIALEVQIEGGKFLSSRLALSNFFSCTFTKEKPKLVRDWLESYLNKNPFSFPFFLGSTFSFQILSEIQKIPFGETKSYGDLAKSAGRPKAARAAGAACHKNPFPLFIPCHRVIHSSGKIGGFAFDLEIKKRLLEFEQS